METIKFSLIGKEDLKRGRSTFSVTLADGSVVSLSELNLDSFDKLLSEDDATNSSYTDVLTVRHTTTGTPANGIGTRIVAQAESADETPADLGALEFQLTDKTAASEDSKFIIWLRQAGAAISRAWGFVNTSANLITFTAAPTSDRTWTFQDATDTVVGKATTDTLTNKTLTDPVVNAGSGSETFIPRGNIYADFIQGNCASTGETDLNTFTLPANSLSATGKGIRFRAWGTTRASAIGKTIRMYFGTDVLISNDVTTTPNNQDWEFTCEIYRNGANSQKSINTGTMGAAPQTTNYASHSKDPTLAIIVKVTGQNGSGSSTEISCEGMTVEFIA